MLSLQRRVSALKSVQYVIWESMRLVKVISGGQTGVDRAALEQARRAGLQTGGWAPHKYITANGPDPSLATFGLSTLEYRGRLCDMYKERSKRNVDASDGTLLIRIQSSPGTDKTIGYCQNQRWCIPSSQRPVIPYRKHFVVRTLDKESQMKARAFIVANKIRVLNIAGHREMGPGKAWQHRIEQFLAPILANH